jgi:hypothetical protein
LQGQESAGSAVLCSRTILAIAVTHLPQSDPAEVACATAFVVRAPAAMTWVMVLLVTTMQWQTYTALATSV